MTNKITSEEESGLLSVIDNLTETVQMTIYPNPTTGILTIENIMSGVSIEIYNTLGQVVFHSEVKEGKNQFDFSAFRNGLYIIHLKDINHETIGISQLMIAK